MWREKWQRGRQQHQEDVCSPERWRQGHPEGDREMEGCWKAVHMNVSNRLCSMCPWELSLALECLLVWISPESYHESSNWCGRWLQEILVTGWWKKTKSTVKKVCITTARSRSFIPPSRVNNIEVSEPSTQKILKPKCFYNTPHHPPSAVCFVCGGGCLRLLLTLVLPHLGWGNGLLARRWRGRDEHQQLLLQSACFKLQFFRLLGGGALTLLHCTLVLGLLNKWRDRMGNSI